VDESAKSVAAKNGVGGGGGARHVWLSLGWKQIKAPVRSLAVVVVDIGREHRSEMSFVQNEEPVKALISDGPDEPLGVGIGSGCPPRGSQDPDPLRREHLIKGGAEPVVTVVDQELDGNIAAFSNLRKISRDLGCTRTDWWSRRLLHRSGLFGCEDR
jgi:hypothetical protein